MPRGQSFQLQPEKPMTTLYIDRKDLGLAMEMAGQAGVDNRMGQLAQQLCQAHQQQGNDRRDFSSIQEMPSG